MPKSQPKMPTAQQTEALARSYLLFLEIAAQQPTENLDIILTAALNPKLYDQAKWEAQNKILTAFGVEGITSRKTARSRSASFNLGPALFIDIDDEYETKQDDNEFIEQMSNRLQAMDPADFKKIIEEDPALNIIIDTTIMLKLVREAQENKLSLAKSADFKKHFLKACKILAFGALFIAGAAFFIAPWSPAALTALGLGGVATKIQASMLAKMTAGYWGFVFTYGGFVNIVASVQSLFVEDMDDKKNAAKIKEAQKAIQTLQSMEQQMIEKLSKEQKATVDSVVSERENRVKKRLKH